MSARSDGRNPSWRYTLQRHPKNWWNSSFERSVGLGTLAGATAAARRRLRAFGFPVDAATGELDELNELRELDEVTELNGTASPRRRLRTRGLPDDGATGELNELTELREFDELMEFGPQAPEPTSGEVSHIKSFRVRVLF